MSCADRPQPRFGWPGPLSAGAVRLLIRPLVCLLGLALLSACASHGPTSSARGEAARYAAMAHGDYAPPGPPEDPWGPYIHAASVRFDVPGAWIRAVMHVESGGHEYLNGQLTTSPVGAMGLMQVMPETYQDMASQYGLGNDPYNPRDNIMAGAAYLRLMYDIYGSPGFLAAYNAGPRRLDDYLANQEPLPAETRRYVAMIAPRVQGILPHRISPAASYAMNTLPIEIAPGLRYGGGRSARFLTARRQVPLPPAAPYQAPPVRLAELPAPPPARTLAPPPARVAALVPPRRLHPPPRLGFRFVPTAYAEPPPPARSFHLAGGWAVQVGAFNAPEQARHAALMAREEAGRLLGHARPMVQAVRHGHAVLWRARLTGVSREAALDACRQLAHRRAACMVLSPDAQS